MPPPVTPPRANPRAGRAAPAMRTAPPFADGFLHLGKPRSPAGKRSDEMVCGARIDPADPMRSPEKVVYDSVQFHREAGLITKEDPVKACPDCLEFETKRIADFNKNHRWRDRHPKVNLPKLTK